MVKQNKFVTEAVMIGDRRKYPVLLVVPNWDNLEKWARSKNLTWTSRSELLGNPAVKEKMEREVLGELQSLARFEMPKRIGLLEHEFSIERGELTPTLKVKRRVVDKTYKSLIDTLYEEEKELVSL
jgi:long-chain acyl-CoA synthetase